MKFKDYLKNLNDLAESNPELLDKIVIYSKDDEGNYFDTVKYKPSVGMYIQTEKDFILHNEFKRSDNPEELEINSICIN